MRKVRGGRIDIPHTGWGVVFRNFVTMKPHGIDEACSEG